MDNKIVYITKAEAKLIKTNAIENGDIYLAEIEGAGIDTEEDYVRAMASAFAFPHELPVMNLGWHDDYMQDLLWIEQKEIVMVVHNFDLMLADDPELKKVIIDDFKEIILPWWEGEVVGHMVGGVPRKFVLYLENSQAGLSNSDKEAKK